MFRAPAMLMPHESTVAHEQRLVVENPEKYFRSRQGSLTPSSVAEETAVFAAKPKVVFFFLFLFTATFKSIYVSFFFKSTWVFYIDCVFFFDISWIVLPVASHTLERKRRAKSHTTTMKMIQKKKVTSLRRLKLEGADKSIDFKSHHNSVSSIREAPSF